ncbi:MAG: pantetheine-phosphate adenylyltransferase [Planctomycetes bacterium GWF2_41_51]|nr:MAG: pantetheine-phosphate adenylyltransferase [Planctomycetes bacterium GWF2_41_51]HBG27347.1 pantetheine-phosphate adenylyltransferase [Phycisphaerales bacterium]
MAKKFVRAVFPGSFDPITNGHLDVINRGIKLFDELIVAVGNSPIKNQLFTLEERVEMIKPLIAGIEGVTVQSYDCLTVEYAATVGATAMLRGLRNLTDVQYEFQLAMTNRAVAGIETIFVMTSEQYGFTSSTLIRQIANLGGNVSNLIPQSVYEKLKKRLIEKNRLD